MGIVTQEYFIYRMYVLSIWIYNQYISQLVTSITGIQAQKTSTTEEPFLIVTVSYKKKKVIIVRLVAKKL